MDIVKKIINRDNLESPVITESGEEAWSAAAVVSIMQQAIDNGWVVLGGDVMTDKGEYTYDNWHYDPAPIPGKADVEPSVRKCLEYIEMYTSRNGDCFRYILVLTQSI